MLHANNADGRRFPSLPVTLYGVLTGLFYGVIFSGQVLGLAGLYRSPWVIVPFALVGSGIASWLYFRQGKAFFEALTTGRHASTRRPLLDWVLLSAGVLILVLLVLVPLIRWPLSPINEILHWDAGAYHFPKAIELFRTGSAWPLTIAYAEYPFGYESLLSFGLVLTGNEALFGTIHAFIALYLLLTIWLLGRRYTHLPDGILVLSTSLLLFSGRFVPSSNPFWIFTDLVYMIGKNDLWLGVLLLGMLLHIPAGPKSNQKAYHLIGLALLTMLAFSTKPNSVYLAVPAWVWVGYQAWRDSHISPKVSFPWSRFVLAGGLILPGLLWAVRNLVVMQWIFDPATYGMQSWSIANTMFNPAFYVDIPKSFIFVSGFLVICLAAAFVFRWLSISQALALVFLFIGFILTPESAHFGGDPNQPVNSIAWRFGIALLGYVFLLLLVFGERPVHWILDLAARSWPVGLATVVLVGGATAGLVYQNRSILTTSPKNQIVIEDQFRDPVGVDGYHSAYDYVRKNIRGAAIHVENGLPYYAYGPGFTNLPNHFLVESNGATTGREINIDYYLVFRTSWWGGTDGNYPKSIQAPDWSSKWQLIYEDSQGRVYKRIGTG